MFEILPSPGTAYTTWPPIDEKIALVMPFAKAIHVDIIDGKFADNKTLLDPTPYKKYANDLLLEVHLMTDNPMQYLRPFADAGFRRFIGHIEKMPSQEEFVAAGQLLGEVGLAIDGKTPLTDLRVPLDDLDVVLIMTINAGFSGQKFMEEHIEKIRQLRVKTTIPIEVDGGITNETINKVREAGANRCVATSFIYNASDPKIAYETLVATVSKTQQS